MEEKIKVLVVDDSPLMRSIVTKMIETQNDMKVVGTAMNGEFALQKIPIFKPDIITLDIEMPVMNGIEFLEERKKRKINIPVIVFSSIAKKGAKVTVEALTLGASDFVTKPSDENEQSFKELERYLTSLIRVYTKKNYLLTKSISEKSSEIKKTFEQPPKENPANKKFDILAIGISTGGPNALRILLSQLKEDFKLPILIVQHMPAGFTAEFAASLDKICPLNIKEAEDGDLIYKGNVYIAPGDKHIRIEKKGVHRIIVFDEGGTVNGHKPSAGILFDSVASQYKNKAIALIMTGMGKDGAVEIGNIFKSGGYTIAQDEGSSIVFGMPRIAIQNEYINKILPLQEMAKFLTNLIS